MLLRLLYSLSHLAHRGHQNQQRLKFPHSGFITVKNMSALHCFFDLYSWFTNQYRSFVPVCILRFYFQASLFIFAVVPVDESTLVTLCIKSWPSWHIINNVMCISNNMLMIYSCGVREDPQSWKDSPSSLFCIIPQFKSREFNWFFSNIRSSHSSSWQHLSCFMRDCLFKVLFLSLSFLPSISGPLCEATVKSPWRELAPSHLLLLLKVGAFIILSHYHTEAAVALRTLRSIRE